MKIIYFIILYLLIIKQIKMHLYYCNNGYVIEIESFDCKVKPAIPVEVHSTYKYDPDHIGYLCGKFQVISIKHIFGDYVDSFHLEMKYCIFKPTDKKYPNDKYKFDKIISKNDYVYIHNKKLICYLSEMDAIYSQNFEYLIDYTKKNKIGFVGYCKTYHENGFLKSEFYHNNGIKEGEYKEYYDDSRLHIECTFVNNQYHGEYLEYSNPMYNRYKLCKKINYAYGKKHGNYIEYNNFEEIVKKWNYMDGKLNGECLTYDYTGGGIIRSKKIVSNYINDNIVNPIIIYHCESNDVDYIFKDKDKVLCKFTFDNVLLEKYKDIIEKLIQIHD